MKAFVIFLPEKEHSVNSSRIVLKNLIDYNIDAQLFEGTPGNLAVLKANKANKVLYPYGIKNQELSKEELSKFIVPGLQQTFFETHFGKIYRRQGVGNDVGKMSKPGVIGCFYSHYGLWQKCVDLDEPIMIFEDDVKFYRNFQPIDWEDVLVLALGKQTYLGDPYKTFLENPTGIPQAHAWRNFSMPGCVGYAIKPHVARRLVKFYRPYWYPADNAINSSLCTIQISSYQMGRTTLPEEGNVSSIKVKDW
jgi:hypothetical protein